MRLLPTLTELVARGQADLRMGLPVVLADDRGGGVLAIAAEVLGDARLAELRARGAVVLAITAWRAATLKARAYDGDLARLTLPGGADAAWVRAIADPADDLRVPMKGPLHSLRDGPAGLHRLALLLAKSAALLPAAVVVPVADARAEATALNLTLLSAAAAAADVQAQHPLAPVAAAHLPLQASEDAKLHIFRPEDGGVEHYAIEIGRPPRPGPVLVRLHSACFTGDVLGSLKCDCGAQLHGALARMGTAGAGILLYLNQEGRGIGLANKMRAYALQDQGFDTVEANHRLGFEDDERDFRTGAGLLRRMGIRSVQLLTNNPRKVRMMQAEGVEVAARVPLITAANRHNAQYLQVKRRKSGHLL
ncbi:MAG: GTP cyclohydrolase II [Rhodobacteraceae bacterium]|nr:GTP cyclohydrolase II [Paracoccaceae bacterium]